MAQPTVDRARVTFLVYDLYDNEGSVSHDVDTDSAYSDVALGNLYDKFVACTDGAVEGMTLSLLGRDPSVAGAAGAYDDIEDVAELHFQAGDGSTVTFSIPCPKAAIFTPDERTVNPAYGAISDLIVEILLTVLTKGGKALVEYIRGERKRRKSRSVKPGALLRVP